MKSILLNRLHLTPLPLVPVWSRDIERRRRALGLTASGLSMLGGAKVAYWSTVYRQATPPGDWAARVAEFRAALETCEARAEAMLRAAGGEEDRG